MPKRFKLAARINVQSTSMSRRKPGITRGSRRLPAGRKPKGLHQINGSDFLMIDPNFIDYRFCKKIDRIENHQKKIDDRLITKNQSQINWKKIGTTISIFFCMSITDACKIIIG